MRPADYPITAQWPRPDVNDLQILVINLDRSVDRLTRIDGALGALGLPFSRVPAVDGRQLSEAERSQAIDEAAYRRRHGMSSLPGEIGCYLSHVKAIRQFLQGDARAALILEDDVQPDTALPAVLQALLECPTHWDMVKVSGVHSGTPVRVRPLTPDHWLAVMLSRCTGSSAYVINRQAAAVYLQRLLPMTLPYDHVYDQGWRFGLQVRLVTPRVARHDQQVATTIVATAPGQSRKFHWTRRLPAFAYRLGNEWRRVRYALGQLWRARAAG